MKDRALALAGLLQAVDTVVAIAANGHTGDALVKTALDSVFRIDAPSTEAVFGEARNLARGLHLLAAHASGNAGSSAQQGRIAFTVLQVERRLAARRDVLELLGSGIQQIKAGREQFDVLDPELQRALGELYAKTISTLTPRVMVQGDPALLARSEVVMQIRAVLLAAIRSAVLWRQLGGSYWDFFLRRGALTRAASEWLRRIESAG